MLNTTQRGIQLVFDNGACPALPPGWTLVRKPKCLARAHDPQGVAHLIALDPPRLVRIMSERPMRADFANPIPL
jgi:hypothetical protein